MTDQKTDEETPDFEAMSPQEWVDWLQRSPEAKEELRQLTALGRCFAERGIIDSEDFHKVVVTQVQACWEAFRESPCCGSNDFRHIISAFGQLCVRHGFSAGARAGNLTYEGLDTTPIPLPSDDDLDELSKSYIEYEKGRQDEAKNRVDEVVEKLGFETIEFGDKRAVVINGPEALEKLLAGIAGRESASDSGGEAPRGMYL